MIVEGVAILRDRVVAVSTRRAGDRPAADGDGVRRRRRPDIGGEVRMQVVDAGIDDADDDGARTDGLVPRASRTNVGTRRPGNTADDLSEVLQSPQLREPGIVRLTVRIDDVVRLDERDVAARRQRRDQGRHVSASRSKARKASGAQRLFILRINLGAQTAAVSIGTKADDYFARRNAATAKHLGSVVAGTPALSRQARRAHRPHHERRRENRAAGPAESCCLRPHLPAPARVVPHGFAI